MTTPYGPDLPPTPNFADKYYWKKVRDKVAQFEKACIQAGAIRIMATPKDTVSFDYAAYADMGGQPILILDAPTLRLWIGGKEFREARSSHGRTARTADYGPFDSIEAAIATLILLPHS